MRPGRLLRRHTRFRVIVTLKSGESFDGVLFDVDREAIVLRKAVALGVGEKRDDVSVDGEVLILRVDVAFMQIP